MLLEAERCVSSNPFSEVSNFIPNILDMYKYFDIIIRVFILLRRLMDFHKKKSVYANVCKLNSYNKIFYKCFSICKLFMKYFTSLNCCSKLS